MRCLTISSLKMKISVRLMASFMVTELQIHLLNSLTGSSCSSLMDSSQIDEFTSEVSGEVINNVMDEKINKFIDKVITIRRDISKQYYIFLCIFCVLCIYLLFSFMHFAGAG